MQSCRALLESRVDAGNHSCYKGSLDAVWGADKSFSPAIILPAWKRSANSAARSQGNCGKNDRLSASSGEMFLNRSRSSSYRTFLGIFVPSLNEKRPIPPATKRGATRCIRYADRSRRVSIPPATRRGGRPSVSMAFGCQSARKWAFFAFHEDEICTLTLISMNLGFHDPRGRFMENRY